jgi:hypothetical protein
MMPHLKVGCVVLDGIGHRHILASKGDSETLIQDMMLGGQQISLTIATTGECIGF